MPKSMTELRRPARWRSVLLVSVLALETGLALVIYAVEPPSVGALVDAAVRTLDRDAYGPTVREAERRLRSADRAASSGLEERADALRWEAARLFALAGEGATDPSRTLDANDRAVATYLELGREALARGRGRFLGLGGDSDALGRAERAGACAAPIAPTRLRPQVNAYLEDLEDVLDRAPSGRCRS